MAKHKNPKGSKRRNRKDARERKRYQNNPSYEWG
jgi:hypothetical protein